MDARGNDEVIARIGRVDTYRRSIQLPDCGRNHGCDGEVLEHHSGKRAGPPRGPEPSQTADEYVKSGRQMVLDVLGKLYSTTEDANVCPYCGSTEHEHLLCDNPGKDAIKNALNIIRDCMTEKSEAAVDAAMDDALASGQNVEATVEGEIEVSEEEDDVVEDNLCDVPLYMSEVGDRDEHRIATSRREDRQSPRIWIEA